MQIWKGLPPAPPSFVIDAVQPSFTLALKDPLNITHLFISCVTGLIASLFYLNRHKFDRHEQVMIPLIIAFTPWLLVTLIYPLDLALMVGFPFLTIVAFDLGMRDSPVGLLEALLKVTVALLFSSILYGGITKGVITLVARARKHP